MNEAEILRELRRLASVPDEENVVYVGPGTSQDNPQKQKEVMIQAAPDAAAKVIPKLEKEFHGVDAPTSRYGEAMRQWVNPALQMQLEAVPSKAEEAEAKERRDSSREKFLDRASQPIPIFSADTSEEESELRSLKNQKEAAGDYPKRDLWTEAIYSLGPGLLGAVTGETGRGAALPAYKSSMEYRNTMRKEDLEEFKAARAKIEDAEKALNQRIKDKNDVAYKRTRNVLDWGKAQLDALRFDATKTAEQKSELSQLVAKAIGEAAKGTTQAAERIAEFDQRTDEFDENMRQKELDRKSREKVAKTRPNPGQGMTPFQKGLETGLAKKASDYFSTTRDSLINNVDKVGSAVERLRESSTGKREAMFGAARGIAPDMLRSFTNPDAVATKEAVQSAITDTLRPTLGAQFTAEEGARIMRLAINDRLSDAENLKRVEQLQKAIQKKVDATDALYAHLSAGRRFEDFDFKKWDMRPMGGGSAPGGTAQAPSGSPSRQEMLRKELERRRAEKGKK
jgi:hypothetical protein